MSPASSQVLDNGVSPIIGIILIVAITVILAAVVGVVAMGLVGDIQGSHEVGLTVKPYAEVLESSPMQGVVVTIHGGSSANELRELYVNIGEDAAGDGSRKDPGKGKFSPSGILIGKPYKYCCNTGKGLKDYENVPVIIHGVFTDGSRQILYSSRMTIPKSIP